MKKRCYSLNLNENQLIQRIERKTTKTAMEKQPYYKGLRGLISLTLPHERNMARSRTAECRTSLYQPAPPMHRIVSSSPPNNPHGQPKRYGFLRSLLAFVLFLLPPPESLSEALPLESPLLLLLPLFRES